MMRSNKMVFFRNTIALYLMSIVKLVFPLLTLPYLTRTLSTDMYGIVTYVRALIVYVQLVIDFGFLLSATKEIVFVAADKEKVGRITGDTLAEKGILAIYATLFFIIISMFIPILNQNKLFSSLYLLSALVTIFLFDFMFRGLEKMHLIAIPYIVAKSITTFLTFVMIHGDGDLLLIPTLEIVGNIVAVIISFYFVRKLEIKISFSSFREWLKDLRESFVYFISNFATTVFGALTTVVAGFYLSMSNIAFWGICMQILSAAKALYNPITNSLYPHMLREKDINIIKKINIIMIIPMLIGSAIVFFASETVMQVIGGDKYISAGNVLRILLPAFIFSFYSMLYGWPVLGAIGKVKETTTTTIIASVVQVCGLGILILSSNLNLYGLAISCSLSEITLFVIRYFVYCRNKKFFKSDS
ncbi:oligosaccharide flippase family protein [Clostridium paridis]|uniref:Oligosaccharide flippase family protein n=1 Tax=Clostridium paridis TaxID=2803863 RepID=A0A937K5H9_9CLOT|nr:oligosaccharide flippase family protein [Clostridium paridis]MBL4932593.1 oligosaccharide flippase family protein [Clostridium paridis]